MKSKGVRRENETHALILFDLSSDPSYPFHESDKVINQALQDSIEALNSLSGNFKELNRVCRSGAAKKNYERLRGEWDDLTDSHNELGIAVSDYLLSAQRALESRAMQESIKENTGVQIKYWR
jgi:hypothetical protein